jgi:hypothetical protein
VFLVVNVFFSTISQTGQQVAIKKLDKSGFELALLEREVPLCFVDLEFSTQQQQQQQQH